MTDTVNLNMHPSSRTEALKKNSNHYFTGVPCRNGHIDKRRTTDGHCLTCDCEYQKRKRKNRPEDVSRMRKAYYQKTRKHQLKIKRNNYAASKQLRLRHRDTMLRSKYGIGVEEYNLMEVSQFHKCAICRNSQNNKRTNYFDVDHSHKTGKVRGLLCTNCNQGIGKFQDNKELLLHAYNYLKETDDE